MTWRPGSGAGSRPVARALLALASVVAVLAPGAAAAQEEPPGLRLAAQSAWVEPNGTFVAELLPTGTVPPEAELALSLHQRITARSEYTRTTTSDELGSVLAARTALPLTELPGGPGGTVVVSLPLRDASAPVDAERVRLSVPGVYPVRLELRTPAGDVLAGLTTYLSRVPADADGPRLGAAVVVPVAAPPALQPDGSTRIDPVARADLTATISALAARPDVPVTVQPVPETLDALRTSPEDLDNALVVELATALETRQLLAGPFVALDVTAWLDRDRADEVVRQLQVGADVIVDTLAARPDGRTWLGTPDLSAATLAALAGAGVDQAIVPETVLSPVDRPLTLAQPFEVEIGAAQRIRAVAADAALAAHVPRSDTPDADPVLAAHRVLADLAVLSFDSPSLARGVVLVPPGDWRPGDGFLATLLEGLTGNPMVQPITVDQLFRDVPPATSPSGDPLVRSLEPAPSEPLGSFPAELDRTRERVEGYGSMTSVADPLLASLSQRLLVAPADIFSGGQRRAYLASVDSEIEAQASQVALPPDETVTLTARDAEIPLTITSTAEQPLRVRISLSSDKLDFPEGASQVVTLEEEKTTVLFAVEARASGSFPVDVSLSSPDERLPMSTTRLTVRSTAVSNVGLVLSVGAGLFLLVWWVLHHHRARRSRLRHVRSPAPRDRAGTPV